MVTQLAALEQDEDNYTKEHFLLFHSKEKKVQKKHIKKMLCCLNQTEQYAKGLSADDIFERDHLISITNVEEEKEDKRLRLQEKGLQEAENAVYNMLSACAAVEKGCRLSEKDPIEYGGAKGYPNIVFTFPVECDISLQRHSQVVPKGV